MPLFQPEQVPVDGDTGYIVRIGAVMLTVRQAVFTKVETFAAREVAQFGVPTLITRSTNDVQQVQMIVFMTFTFMIAAPIMCVGGIIMALRQDVKLSGLLLAVIPALAVSVGLIIRQFFLHTEKVEKLWRSYEFVFNTPSHHSVHHGSDPIYLDRNYGGILIIWDRLLGSFQEEQHRPAYGLTAPVESYKVFWLQFGEFAAILRDVRNAVFWRERFGYVLGPPGWTPALRHKE